MAGLKKKNTSGWTVAVVVALIGAVPIIIVGWWQYRAKPSPQTRKYVGRVKDALTEDKIRNAKVSLEGRDVPAVIFTDSEGIFSFSLAGGVDQVHVTVEATGYEKFDLQVLPAANTGIEDIRLKRLPTPLPEITPTPADKKKPRVTKSVQRPKPASRRDEAIQVLLGKKNPSTSQ
jgi:hypothetical protein